MGGCGAGREARPTSPILRRSQTLGDSREPRLLRSWWLRSATCRRRDGGLARTSGLSGRWRRAPCPQCRLRRGCVPAAAAARAGAPRRTPHRAPHTARRTSLCPPLNPPQAQLWGTDVSKLAVRCVAQRRVWGGQQWRASMPVGAACELGGDLLHAWWSRRDETRRDELVGGMASCLSEQPAGGGAGEIAVGKLKIVSSSDPD